VYENCCKGIERRLDRLLPRPHSFKLHSTRASSLKTRQCRRHLNPKRTNAYSCSLGYWSKLFSSHCLGGRPPPREIQRPLNPFSSVGPSRLSSAPPIAQSRSLASGFSHGRLFRLCRTATYLSSAGASPTSPTSELLYRIEPCFTSGSAYSLQQERFDAANPVKAKERQLSIGYFWKEDYETFRRNYTGRTVNLEKRGTTGGGGGTGSGIFTSTRMPDPVLRSVTCPSYSAARCLIPITPMP
jgi:hypothetical protein